MPLKAWFGSECSRRNVQGVKRTGNRIQEVCGWLCCLSPRVSSCSIISNGEDGTKMWVRPHGDMRGPKKDSGQGETLGSVRACRANAVDGKRDQ